jgi:hypothetical protein
MTVCCGSRLVFIDYEIKRLPPVEDQREPGVSTFQSHGGSADPRRGSRLNLDPFL